MSRISLKCFKLYLVLLAGVLWMSGCKNDDGGGGEEPTEAWEEISSMPSSFRTHHSFGFSHNGAGYIVTGQSESGPRNEFYRYDPAQDTWSQLDDFPGTPRGFAIGDKANGKVYFGFGYDGDGYLRDLWEFDPAASGWTELAECPCSKRIHPAFVHLNGKIYMGMGEDENNNDLNDWWEYDISSDSWAQKATLPASVRHHPYQFAIGDYVYVGMGHAGMSIFNDLYRYDPATDTWAKMADLPGQGRVAGSQFSYNGKGYLISGDGETHDSMNTGEFWRYDPFLDEWEQLPPHPGRSRWAPSSFIIGNTLYFLNGQSNDVYQGTGYKYQLE